MKQNCIFLALLLLSSIMIVCYGAQESKAVDPEPRVNSVTNSNANTLPKTGDNNVVSQDGAKKDPSTDTSNKAVETKVVPKVGSDKDKDQSTEKPKDTDHSNGKPVVKDGEENKGENGGTEPKTLPKGVTTKGNTEPSKPTKKEGVRGEECGSSNNCVDDKNKLVACLRVPGNDSPELSLLIQYEGTTPLTAEISAPDSVHLGSKSVQFHDKGSQKVKVSLGKDNKKTIIVLTAKGSNCSIDFSDLIQRNSAEKPKDTTTTTTTTKPSILEIVTNNPYLVIIISIGIIIPIVVAIPICIMRRRKQQQLTSYQKLETELPVSVTGGKKETDEEEGGGWDDSWGDSWDDEEAPKTPSLPITPSLSSKGLASRKLTKDSWKD